MINKIIKAFFKKEQRKESKIKLKRLGNMYIASQIELAPHEEQTELHEYFSNFLGLKQIAKLRENDLQSVVANNA